MRIQLVLLLLFSSIGCATHADRAESIRAAFYNGDVAASLAQTDPETKKRSHDANVLQLDRAIVQLTSGEPAAAEQTLRLVRDKFDQLEDKSYINQAKSLFTDDRQLNYAGEEYERILIRVMLGLSNLMHDGGDVAAYALQVTAKQQQLLREAQKKNEIEPASHVDVTPLTKQLAIGSYMRAAVLETSPLDYDDVERCRVQVANWQPDFRDAKIDLARAETGQHSKPDHGVVYVFTLVGEGPYKVEAVEAPTTVALLIADRILSAAGDHELPPNIAPVKIPVVVRPPQRIDHVALSEQDQVLGNTATIMNVSELAVEQNRLDRDRRIAMAVARRITKKATVYAAKDRMNVESSPHLDLLLTIAGVAWEASERADTRCWSLLPDRIQVARLELPVGHHQLTLTPQLKSSLPGEPTTIDVEVLNGRTSFVLGCFPNDRAVGQPLAKTYR